MGEDTIMAVAELKQSRASKNGKERTLLYTVTGSNDDAVAEAALLVEAPAVYRGLPRSDYTLEWIGDGIWTAELQYKLVTSPDQQQEPGNVGSTVGQVSLVIGGATTHRTHSDSTVASYGDNPPDHDQAIGVEPDGTIRGCDVQIASISYRETHYFNPASLTQSYRNAVEDLADNTPVNDAPFKGRAAGEVRFDGAEFSLSDGEKVVATYQFSISKNRTGMTIGGISGIDKDGWDYLWPYYIDAVDSNNKPIKVLEAIYVERVYQRGDFSVLQIGT